MEEPGEWIVGNHQLRFEPPDTHWAIVRGWITKEDGERWVELIHEMTANGPVYCVVRMTPMPGFPQPRLSQEARQHLAKHSNSDWFKAMVYVGGGLLQNITAKGLTVAMLLSGRKRFDVEFVKDEDEARKWIAQHRRKERR